MRVVHVAGRLGLLTGDGILDVATASAGRFDADIQRVFDRRAQLPEWAKFPASITGPNSTIGLPRGSVDFEAELVVVIGREAYQVSRDDAWDYVAGLTVGQDLSERELQLRPPTPQFNLGKSFPGFAPMGPELVTPDEFADPNDLEINCAVNGVQMKKSRTSNMIFPVAVIIEKLSEILPLYPVT